MNTIQLERVMRSDPYGKWQFRGVCAADQLPKTVIAYPSAFIVNTDPASKPGTHWVAFYFSSQKKGEFFDSYGNEPNYYNKKFEHFLKNHCSTWTYNHITLQSLSSRQCGNYCLFYLLYRCRGVTPTRILNCFRKNKEWNDRFVEQFICNRFAKVLKQKTCNPSQSCASVYSKSRTQNIM